MSQQSSAVKDLVVSIFPTHVARWVHEDLQTGRSYSRADPGMEA